MGSTKPLIRPRKSPRQGRSAELVSSVFEACVRILKSPKGLSFTTRSVAELAGISVGSLYQYFPNKEALIGALIEREANRHVEKLKLKYGSVKDHGAETVVRVLVEEILGTIEKDKAFLRGILTSVFFVERLDTIIQAREASIRFIETVLLEQKICADSESARPQAYAIVAALGGIVETLIFRKDEGVSVARLMEEAVRLVWSYCARG